jgi:hypothetical protein
VNCTANGKRLCENGVQSRYESGRGIVSYPCAICRTAEFEAVMKEWKPAHGEAEIIDDAWEEMRELWKAKPGVTPVQQSMFEEREYPG